MLNQSNFTLVSLLLGASLALVLIGQQVTCDPHPWGENVCNISVPHMKNVAIETPVEYEIKVQSMCGILPCTKIRKETRMDHSIKPILQYYTKPTCCSGYTETPNRRCAPICLQSCGAGKCVAPNVCKCQPEPSESSPGFVGPTCSRFVCANDNVWGSRCDRPCSCSPGSNSFCSADTGKCMCYPGWRGANCTDECKPSDPSDECEQYNRMPAIMEPNANLLMSENLIMGRQKPEALVLDDEIRITPDEGHDRFSTTPTYLVAILSLACAILLVAFLAIKRRYHQVKTELYYSAASAAGSSQSSDGSNSIHYSQATPASYYTGSMVSSNGDYDDGRERNFEKNLSFASATRQILLGKDVNSLSSSSQPGGEGRRKIVYDPRTESSLITSQRAAQQNLYSDVIIDCDKPTPPPLPKPNVVYSMDDQQHIYQVPRSLTHTSGAAADEEDNIYEEIKPTARK